MVAVASPASPARAEPVRFGLESAFGYSWGGQIHYGIMIDTSVFVSKGPWRLGVELPAFIAMHSDHPERDSTSLFGFGLGAQAGYALRLSPHAEATALVGLDRDWLLGSNSVVRECQVTRRCIAGTYLDDVAYHGWTPTLRIGIGPLLEDRHGKLFGGAAAIVRFPRIGDVPPDGVHEVVVTLALTVGVAWDGHRGP